MSFQHTVFVTQHVICFLCSSWKLVSMRDECVTVKLHVEDGVSLTDYYKMAMMSWFSSSCAPWWPFTLFAYTAANMTLRAELCVETQSGPKYQFRQLQFYLPDNRGQWLIAHMGLKWVTPHCDKGRRCVIRNGLQQEPCVFAKGSD